MIGVSKLQSFIASMTQKLTLSDISDESKNYLDKAGFFFQAEDGIRDFHVTGVQTCALPIWRQDRRREPDAARIGSRRLAIAYTRLADGDRTDTGHHLALRQVAVADDALVAVLGLQIGMLAEIGRASCRERVESEGGAGSVKT